MSSLTEAQIDELKSQAANAQAYQQNMTAMANIVASMKEVPELPSEQPTDVQPLTRVEFPEYGVLTYMGGFEHPYKGFPFAEFVEKIDYIKKIQRGFMSSLYHSFRRRTLLQKACLIVVPWMLGDIVDAYIESFHRLVSRFKIKPIRYSDAIRELHRAMSLEWFDDSEAERDRRLKVRDIVCMFLEFDNAYRFRFQDIAVELDKVNLKKDPGGEIVRLLTLMQSRETTQEIRDTWTLVKTFLPWYLRFNRRLSVKIAGILESMDSEKVRLSVEDRQFCEKRKDYTFGYTLCQQQHTISAKDSPASPNR